MTQILVKIALVILCVFAFLVIVAGVVTALIPGSQITTPTPFVIVGVSVAGAFIAITQIAGMFGYTLKDFSQAIQPKSSEKDKARKKLLKSGQPHVLREAAQEVYSNRDYEWALTITQSLLKLRPDDAIGHEVAGNSLRRLDRAKEAIRVGEKLIQIQPNASSGYEIVADSYRDLHEWTKALSYYEKALVYAQLPMKPYILRELSELYETTGDLVKAIESQKEFVESKLLDSKSRYEGQQRLRHLQKAQNKAIK